jgi:translin
MSLKSILDKIQEEAKKRSEAREEVQRDMRRATRLSKQAIHFTHQGRCDDARKLLVEAGELFTKLEAVAKDNPGLAYTGAVDAAFQEFAEAQILIGLIEEKQFISPGQIRTPSVSYILGLADVIGELRRRILDLIRREEAVLAEDCLRVMEQIYVELVSLDEAHLYIPGLRRKCDVARRIIESTRGDVTIEKRRGSLERSIKGLEKAIQETDRKGK